MARRVIPSFRAAALILAGSGFLTLLGGPGLSAPARKRPNLAPPAGLRSPRPGLAPVRPPLPQPPAIAQRRPSEDALPPPGNRLMPASEVRPGMKGYGLTVFHGTRIERFDVEVVDVMPKMNMGRPYILVRISGGPITGRGAYLIQGMSGSPVYVDGKLIGAFSAGFPWSKEPLGMVTPIDDMMEALDPKLGAIPAGESASDYQGAEPPVSAGSLDPQSSSLSQSFRQLALPVTVSGFSPRNLERVAGLLRPYNLNVVQGPGGGAMDRPFKASLTPGAAIGVSLITGDVDMTALGTVTYRDGDRLLAFGHPYFQIGAVQFPITTMWIHDVFPGMQASFKMGAPGEPCGTLTQDRPFSIAGKVGPVPNMIPVRYTVTDKSTGRGKTYNVRTANHPIFVGQLLPIAVNQGVFEVRPVPGDATARIKMTVETEGAGTVKRENVVYDANAIDTAVVRELTELMGILSSNTFRRVPVKSLSMDVTIEATRPTATVDRIYLSQNKFEPGDTVDIGVVIRPYRKEPVLLKTKIKVPENAANGRAILMVQGGATRVNLAPLLSGGMPGGGLTMTPPPDASLKQVLDRFSERERNDQVVARIIFPTAAVNVNGERLSQLPSPIVDVMRTSRSTGFRIERDEAKAIQDTPYVVQGLQTLEIVVEKRNQLERPSTGAARPGGAAGAPGLGGPPPGSGSLSLSAGADLDDLARLDVLHFSVDGQPRVLRLTPEEEEAEVGEAPKSRKPEKPKDSKDSKSDGKSAAPGTAPAGAKPAASAPPVTVAPAAAVTEDKPVGRQATLWTQTTQADFERGTHVNTAVSTSGDVRLTPGLRLLHESGEQFVWSLAGSKGSVYAGTGNGGQVLKIDAEGKTSVFCRTGELEVHSLARDKSGNLYAGTSPNGKIFKIAPDGTSTEVYCMNGKETASEAGSKFVLALAVADDGAVYAGTGPKGKILRIRDGKTDELCTVSDSSVMSLLVGPNNVLYAGAADEGRVYKISLGAGASRAEILYGTDQAAVTGLALDRAGNLYAACAPSGEIYKIEPDGTPRVHFNKSRGALYGLLGDGSGTLYACGGGAVMRIEPDGQATLLSDRKNAQFTALAWDDQGRMLAGSANIGTIYRLAPSVSGSFESTVHDAKLPSRWGRMRYTGMMPDKAVLTVESRSGNTHEPDSTWSPWQAPASRDGGMFVTSPPARFLQYRILLQAEAGSPSLRDMSIAYLPRNQAPKLTLAAPAGGEIWKGTQALKWAAVDADKDTLTYEIAYSADGGVTWKPVGETLGPAAPAPEPAPAKPERASAEGALERYRKQLDADTALSPQQRDENYEKAKSLVERFLKDTPDSTPAGPPPAARPGAAPAAAPPASPPSAAKPAGVTRQATLNWDTKQVPDGIYVLRVVATDRASNPSDALQDTQLSEPFIVSNTPPQVFLFEKGIVVDAERRAAAVGFVSGRVSLKAAQYRVGEGEWTAVDPEDGIWDSAFEHFRFVTSPAAAGSQTLELKVFDAAGNVQTSKASFKVP